MNALRFVVEYGRACDDLEEETLTVEEYGDHVGISRAQAFRRQSAFRTCFPGDDVLDVWAIFRPFLDASNFKDESPTKQAVYVGSLVFNPKKGLRGGGV